jgi:hypothetical protein
LTGQKKISKVEHIVPFLLNLSESTCTAHKLGQDKNEWKAQLYYGPELQPGKTYLSFLKKKLRYEYDDLL